MKKKIPSLLKFIKITFYRMPVGKVTTVTVTAAVAVAATATVGYRRKRNALLLSEQIEKDWDSIPTHLQKGIAVVFGICLFPLVILIISYQTRQPDTKDRRRAYAKKRKPKKKKKKENPKKKKKKTLFFFKFNLQIYFF